MRTRLLIVTALAALLLVGPSLVPVSHTSPVRKTHMAVNLDLASLISQFANRFVVTINAAGGCDADFLFYGNGYYAGWGGGTFNNGEQEYLYVDWADGSGAYNQGGGTAGEDDVYLDQNSGVHHYSHGGYYPYVEFGSTSNGWCATANPVI